MVFTASQMDYGPKAGNVGEEANGQTKFNEELVLQRRKANSPTIEDDFTVDLDDDDEPFDEPRSTPTAASMKTADKKNKLKDGNDKAGVDAEIDMLCWTGSELDGDNGKDEEHDDGVEDKSKSVRSLVWSESELDDVKNISAEQRDDFVNARENMESREKCANPFNNAVDDSMHAVLMMENNSVRNEERGPHHNGDKKGQRKAGVQFHLENEDNNGGKDKSQQPKEDSEAQPVVHSGRKATTSGHYEDVAVRAERSTDSAMEEDELTCYGGDENSAFSVTPSMAPSVAASVTKRTRNTKFPNPKSPRSPRSAFRAMNDDTETTMTGQSTVMTADIEAGMTATCSMRRAKKVKGKNVQTKIDGEEDLLDRFFENMESRVCKTPKNGDEIPERTSDNEEDRLKRLINPFLDKLEKFDSVFEQLEEIACPEEDKKDDDGFNAKTSTNPAAFAAAKFTQLLDQIEKFDPGFAKSKATACQNIYDKNAEDDSEDDECNNADNDATQSTDPSNKESSLNDSPYDVLEKAYQRAETMVKEQKRTSFDKKDQLQKMKEQWFAARLNWKLRQSILTEAVKQNTTKAAETTTKCVDTMVSSCHPFMSSAATATVDKKDKKKKSRSSQKETPILVNNGYDSESDADALSVDNSDFFSMMSPSEHSNINSKHGGFRSNILSPSEHSNAQSSAFLSHSDHVVRSPQCLSPSSRNGDSIADVVSNGPSDEEGEDDDVTNVVAAIGVSTGPLAVITEEVAEAESMNSDNAAKRNSDNVAKRNAPKKKDSAPTLRQWAYPAPSYYTESSGHSRGSEIPSNPKEWLEKWKTTVVFHSERILDRAQCASASINFADSNSFEDDQDGNEGVINQSGRDSAISSTSQRVKQQNSIIEDEDYSVSVMATPKKKVDIEEHFDESSVCYDDDLSGFETAVQDERPPMLRLQKSRTDSKSSGSREGSRDGSRDGIESNKSTSRGSSSVHSRLSTEVPEGYTLADSIRHASISSRNNGANRTRMSQEPRGNKLKKDPSTHVRSRHLPLHPLPPTDPKLSKQDPDFKPKDQQRIRSPRSSETNDTSDMTAMTSSSSDVGVTKMADSTHSKRSLVIHVENPEAIQHEPLVDEDGDKGTVFSYNTTSTGSTEFKDCYQDSIPSMSTMGTVHEDETPSLSAPKNIVHKEKMPEVILNTTTFLPSDEHIVKSMALLSVSATVLKIAANNSNKNEYEEYEVESMPSTTSYPEEEIVEDAIVEGNKDSESLLNEVDSIPSTTSYPEEEIVKDAVVEGNKDSESLLNEVDSMPSTTSYPEEEIVEDAIVEENEDSEPLLNEVESMPSTTSYPEEEIVEDAIVEGNKDSEPLLWESSEKVESKASLPTLHEDNHEVEDSHVEENIIRNQMIDFDGNSDPLLLEPKVDQEVDSDMAEDIRLEEDVVDGPIMAGSKENCNEFQLESTKEYELPQPLSTLSVDNPVEDICLENDLKKDIVVEQLVELETVSSDEQILESLKRQESLNQQEFEPMEGSCMEQEEITEYPIMMEPKKQESIGEDRFMVEPPKLQGFELAEVDDEVEVKSTLTTQRVSSRLREPRSVEDRRRRRLRQRRKFEKVLRGEDDSSSTMSSTMSGVGSHHQHALSGGSEFNDNGGPLISASFDTGFGAVPVVEESQCQ